MPKQLIFRMKYNTMKRLRAVFPTQRGESTASYFERLAKELEKPKVYVSDERSNMIVKLNTENKRLKEFIEKKIK